MLFSLNLLLSLFKVSLNFFYFFSTAPFYYSITVNLSANNRYIVWKSLLFMCALFILSTISKRSSLTIPIASLLSVSLCSSVSQIVAGNTRGTYIESTKTSCFERTRTIRSIWVLDKSSACLMRTMPFPACTQARDNDVSVLALKTTKSSSISNVLSMISVTLE